MSFYLVRICNEILIWPKPRNMQYVGSLSGELSLSSFHILNLYRATQL